MKKYIVLFIIAVLAFSVPRIFLGDTDNSTRNSRTVLRVGVECEYVPNSWEERKPSDSNLPIVNNKGYYAEGYDVQIAKIVAASLENDLEVRKIAWNDLIPALRNGEIDAIFSSMLDTEERKKLVAFSDPYEAETVAYAIIVDSVSPYITATSLKDFNGAKIVGERGTKLDDVIEQIPGVIHVKPAETIQAMIDCVLQEKADGAVIDVDTGRYHELINKNLTLITFKDGDGFELGFHGVCAGVRQTDTELLHRINVALAKIPQSERKKIMATATSKMMASAE